MDGLDPLLEGPVGAAADRSALVPVDGVFRRRRREPDRDLAYGEYPRTVVVDLPPVQDVGAGGRAGGAGTALGDAEIAIYQGILEADRGAGRAAGQRGRGHDLGGLDAH